MKFSEPNPGEIKGHHEASDKESVMIEEWVEQKIYGEYKSSSLTVLLQD